MIKTMAQLPYHYGMKVRIFPSNNQKNIIKHNSDASRFIYNEMNSITRELISLRKVKIPIKIVQKRIDVLENRIKKPATEISNIHGWLNEPDLDSLMKANAIKNYWASWKFFRKINHSGTPVFHKKSAEQKYQTNCTYSLNIKVPNMLNGSARLLDNRYLYLPKIGRIRFKGMPKNLLKRTKTTRIGTITISMDATGRYYVSMQLASEKTFVIIPKKHTNNWVGIDLNIDNFLTDSAGNVISNPRYYQSMRVKLAKAQRKLSRRALQAKKEHRSLSASKNYQKQRKIVANIQRKIANRRNNFLHTISTMLIKSHDLVVAEDLRSKNMLKNHALAMHITDVGWRKFLNMLSYKANLYNRRFITVDPHNTTQTCSKCGYVMHGEEKLTLKNRKWTCPNCKIKHIRDLNAAKNILIKGLEKA